MAYDFGGDVDKDGLPAGEAEAEAEEPEAAREKLRTLVDVSDEAVVEVW